MSNDTRIKSPLFNSTASEVPIDDGEFGVGDEGKPPSQKSTLIPILLFPGGPHTVPLKHIFFDLDGDGVFEGVFDGVFDGLNAGVLLGVLLGVFDGVLD